MLRALISLVLATSLSAMTIWATAYTPVNGRLPTISRSWSNAPSPPLSIVAVSIL